VVGDGDHRKQNQYGGAELSIPFMTDLFYSITKNSATFEGCHVANHELRLRNLSLVLHFPLTRVRTDHDMQVPYIRYV